MTNKDQGTQEAKIDIGILYEDRKPRLPTPDWRVNKPGEKGSS